MTQASHLPTLRIALTEKSGLNHISWSTQHYGQRSLRQSKPLRHPAGTFGSPANFTSARTLPALPEAKAVSKSAHHLVPCALHCYQRNIDVASTKKKAAVPMHFGLAKHSLDKQLSKSKLFPGPCQPSRPTYTKNMSISAKICKQKNNIESLPMC